MVGMGGRRRWDGGGGRKGRMERGERDGGDGREEEKCYASRQTYIEVNDIYSEGGTHEETLCPQSKAKVENKRQGDKVTTR